MLVKKKWSNLLKGKREHRMTLGALCDVLAMKWFGVRGWGYILGNYVTWGGVPVKAGDQYQCGRESLIVFMGLAPCGRSPRDSAVEQ